MIPGREPLFKADDVSKWWKSNPQTYASDFHGGMQFGNKKVEFGTREYFESIDAEFYEWNVGHHGDKPFSNLFPYEQYLGKDVLEVGCGQGYQASNWAKAGAKITAVDLNPQAVKITTERFRQFDLTGNIKLCDARELPFDNETFDYVYSWGVLHHSPDIEKSLSEVLRVLKPGGGFGVYLYCRRSFYYLWGMRYVEGFLHFENQFLSPLQLASRYTDGWEKDGNPHTWPVTVSEMKSVFQDNCDDLKMSSLEIFPPTPMWAHFMPPVLRDLVPSFVQRAWIQNVFWNLWISGRKKT
ncbi:class I SAM-dependent methyltransferase [Bythopirellula goksoeyrii]|uniref:Phthiotriol/phenolphthiotriol dimycocerosates methyltransferase n=1 Tax=Bythopirellula goksoeyrii TaxID=1400387 RepID=A0A5B9QAL2_9BACT|nr:class I SAM-dependent methyltransferase [Bythopirellula goksoeyrii]QEG36027.1 Phthiotriol/phenolphthiotriol dimycocerosates methyltransferase [Bythopirellula goksoeyrii]